MFYPNRLIYQHQGPEIASLDEGLKEKPEMVGLTQKEAAEKNRLRSEKRDRARLQELEQKLQELESRKNDPEMRAYFSEADMAGQIKVIQAEITDLRERLGVESKGHHDAAATLDPETRARLDHARSQALLYLKRKKYDAARALLEPLMKSGQPGEKDPMARLALAKVYKELGEMREMAATARLATELGADEALKAKPEKWAREFLDGFKKNFGFVRVQSAAKENTEAIALSVSLVTPLFGKDRKEFYERVIGADGAFTCKPDTPFALPGGSYVINGSRITVKPNEEVTILA